MASAADRFNINSQLEHLQSRYVGTGHADTNRFEWAVNVHRDSYASYFGHHSMLQYFAVAENESIGRVKYNMMQVRAGDGWVVSWEGNMEGSHPWSIPGARARVAREGHRESTGSQTNPSGGRKRALLLSQDLKGGERKRAPFASVDERLDRHSSRCVHATAAILSLSLFLYPSHLSRDQRMRSRLTSRARPLLLRLRENQKMLLPCGLPPEREEE